MLTRAQKYAISKFYLSIKKLKSDFAELLRNLTALHEHIISDIVHEPPIKSSTPILDTDELPFALKLGNAQSLIKSFQHLDLCFSQLQSCPSNENFSVRAYAVITRAKGALTANDQRWHGVLATDLAAALETWEILGMELGASMTEGSDELWRRMRGDLTSSLFSLVEMHQAIGRILHPDCETEALAY